MLSPPNRRAVSMFIEGPRPCDCCDEEKDCASIDIGLVDFVWIICEDCLKEFIYSFKNEKEIPGEIVSSLPDDCRDLTHSAISVAIPEKPLSAFYQLFSHFPTSERCPFKFFMHGDFILDAGRKHLRGDAETYNQ